MGSQGNNVIDLEAGNYVAEEDSGKYLTLYRATVYGKWEEAKKFLEDNKQAILAPINSHKNTALHDAAKSGDVFFVEKLVAMMPPEELSARNRYGLTPLHFAARFGNMKVAEILVGKNYNLLYHRCNKGLFPIHYAACNTRKSVEVYSYFYGVTKDVKDGQDNPFAGATGATLLVNLIKSKFYEVAMELANKYPDLTRHQTLDEETSPLEAIVKYDYPIFNKTSLRFWQTSIQYGLLSKNSVEEKMLKHEEAVKLVECLCDKLKIVNGTQVALLARKAIIEAAYLDIEEVVQNIVEAYPATAYYKDKSGRNILHIAVKNRSINVLNLICGPCRTNVLMHDLVDETDKNGNNILHLAGKLSPPHKLTPPHKLNLVSGSALQMQRELQWFKEVQKIAPPYFSSLKNEDDKTPNMVFRDEHKDLKEKGEKWMKDTATACSIVAALIVTVVFAAAITVPGGNSNGAVTLGFKGTIFPSNNSVPNIILGGYNGILKTPLSETPPEEGLPNFSRKDVFTSFYFLNSASLFAAVPSLLLFLSILTSRYAQQDFLYILPFKLIAGLLTLLLSIIFMMASFATTVYLVFGKSFLSVRMVLMVFTGVTVAAFVFLQLRLFLAFVWSTYGQAILKKLGFTAHNLF